MWVVLILSNEIIKLIQIIKLFLANWLQQRKITAQNVNDDDGNEDVEASGQCLKTLIDDSDDSEPPLSSARGTDILGDSFAKLADKIEIEAEKYCMLVNTAKKQR